MSQLVPSPTCCDPCGSSSGSGGSGTPGEQGPQGDPGVDGADGVSAFTLVANYSPGAQPVMPAEGATVVLTVTTSTSFLTPGMAVYVQGWGTMLVTAVPSDLSVTVQNPEDSGTGEYASNAAPGTSLTAGNKIVPAGIQGIQGPAVTGALLAANNLNDVDDAGTSRTNLGIGTVAVLDSGVSNAQVAPNDGGLTDGDAVFATATGIETKSAVDARAALELGDLAAQAADAVTISGGEINGTLIGATDPAAGNFTLLGADTFVLSGEMNHEGQLYTPSTAIQSLLAATPVDPNAQKIRVVGNGGPVTLTAIPTVTIPGAGSDGQRVTIIGTDDTNTVTFQNNSALAGSKLKLGAASRALGAGDVLDLIWDEVMDRWLETGFVNNS